jgi:hypothetical protein
MNSFNTCRFIESIHVCVACSRCRSFGVFCYVIREVAEQRVNFPRLDRHVASMLFGPFLPPQLPEGVRLHITYVNFGFKRRSLKLLHMLDFVQELYVKELKAYKAPAVVGTFC